MKVRRISMRASSRPTFRISCSRSFSSGDVPTSCSTSTGTAGVGCSKMGGPHYPRYSICAGATATNGVVAQLGRCPAICLGSAHDWILDPTLLNTAWLQARSERPVAAYLIPRVDGFMWSGKKQEKRSTIPAVPMAICGYSELQGKPSHSSRDNTENGSSRFTRKYHFNLPYVTDWIYSSLGRTKYFLRSAELIFFVSSASTWPSAKRQSDFSPCRDSGLGIWLASPWFAHSIP